MKHAAFRLRGRKGQGPEFEIQKHCVIQLRTYMPDLAGSDVWWGASLSGVPLSPHLANIAKAAGLERGGPDISFIFPDGRTKYAEAKNVTSAGVDPNTLLTPEQAALSRILGPTRFVIFASWDGLHPLKPAVEGWLASYGLRLLTDAEAVRRSLVRRRLELEARDAKRVRQARALRRRVERASV